MKWILVVAVKCRHHENGLLARKKIIAKTLACVQTPPPLTGNKFGSTVILTQPHLVSVVRSTVLMFIGNVADWQLVQGGWGEGRSFKQYPNRPEKNVKKHEKLIWKFQWKSCSTTHLHFLQTNSIITGGLFKENIPTKMKRKKRGQGGGGKPKSQGVTFKPQNNAFFLLSMHEL